MKFSAAGNLEGLYVYQSILLEKFSESCSASYSPFLGPGMNMYCHFLGQVTDRISLTMKTWELALISRGKHLF